MVLSLLAVACSDATVPGAAERATGAGGAGGTGGSQSGGGGTGGAAAHPGLPEPLPVAAWMAATVGSASNDAVRDAIEKGEFTLPAEGESYLGVKWKKVVPGDNGALIDTFGDLLYAAAVVSVPEGRHLVARGDTVAGFYADNQWPVPGDFYASHRIRVPLGNASGDVLVVARALGKRGTPEVELWTTDAELLLNGEDLTTPDLVAGETFEQFVGVPVLNLTGAPIGGLIARVEESEVLQASTRTEPAIGPGVTQVGFALSPKSTWPAAGKTVVAHLVVEAPSLAWSYDMQVSLTPVAAGERYRRTRISDVDGSVQYYAVVPPQAVAPGEQYGLVLSLHGASVEAGGQAGAYSKKDWTYIVAPTNRRPFGFDWEEWGRLDAVEALDHAMAAYPVDPTRVHLTGHSMGGHGSWHVGAHFAHRFGMIGPSAGWIDFESYGGPPHPTGPVGRARAASQTLHYLDDFARSSVFVIHGDLDDVVPISHAKTMVTALTPVAAELELHEEPTGRHWWDLDPNEEGADCVDWEPMFAKMATRTVDAVPLDFRWVEASPWINAHRSFVTVRSELDPMQDFVVESVSSGGDVVVTTTNVRALVLDGDALVAAGVTNAVVDGAAHPVVAGPMPLGPAGGKTEQVHGPLNQVFQRPFCLVYEGDGAYRQYASYLASWWAVVGNGHACALPRAQLTDALRSERNLVYLGAPRDAVPVPASMAVDWGTNVTVGTASFDDAVLGFVFPDGERLGAVIVVTPGMERLLFHYMPFTSRSGLPDLFVLRDDGLAASGFFDADWQVEPAFAIGL